MAVEAIALPERTRGTLWSAVLFLAAVLFAGGMIKTVFSPLQEAAKLDLKLSDFATSLVSLFLARMLSALGASCAVPVVISLAADLCRPDQRGRAMVVLGF